MRDELLFRLSFLSVSFHRVIPPIREGIQRFNWGLLIFPRSFADLSNQVCHKALTGNHPVEQQHLWIHHSSLQQPNNLMIVI